LNVVELRVPPLRERREDIPYLTAAFLKEFGARFGKPVAGVSPSAEQILMSAEWRGNVRELRNALERACMLADGHTLSERDLAGAMPPAVPAELPAVTTETDLGSVERDHIVRVLAEVRGNKVAAARLLGISRRTLYRRLERHRLV
jgi:DNA-binding NtrC family response regulator